MSNTIGQLQTLPPSPSTSGTAGGDTLGPDAFLTLLTTELQNQDPTSPMDDTQSVSQLAQFSALQAQTTLSDQFSAFQSNFGVMQSAALIGRQVTVNTTDDSSGSTLTGTVGTISVQNGAPYFTLNNSTTGATLTDNNGSPLLFSTTQIVGIGT